MTTRRQILNERARATEALLRLQAETSLRSFVEQAWPILEPETRYLSNWHIDFICEYLEAVTAGEITRLVINLPPRYMKSLLVSVLWPTWEWLRAPETRWLFASYSDSLSTQHSLDRRVILQSPWYRDRWGDRFHLTSDQNEKTEYRNDRRGVMTATSVGGTATGKGGNRIVVDDPHNPVQAESDRQRQQALDFFLMTPSTRLDDKRNGAIIVIMQRLHTRDLTSVCLDHGYTSLILPAEAEYATTVPFPGRVGPSSARSDTSCGRSAKGRPIWRGRRSPWAHMATPASTSSGRVLEVVGCSNGRGGSITTSSRLICRNMRSLGIWPSRAAGSTTSSSGWWQPGAVPTSI